MNSNPENEKQFSTLFLGGGSETLSFFVNALRSGKYIKLYPNLSF